MHAHPKQRDRKDHSRLGWKESQPHAKKPGKKGRVRDLLSTRKAAAPPAATPLEITHGCARTCAQGNAATGSTAAAGRSYGHGAHPVPAKHSEGVQTQRLGASRNKKPMLLKYTGVKEISSNCSGNNCRRLSLQGQKTPKNLVGNSGRTGGQLAFTKSEHAEHSSDVSPLRCPVQR